MNDCCLRPHGPDQPCGRTNAIQNLFATLKERR